MRSALLDLLLPGSCAGCAADAAPWCPECAGRIGPATVPALDGGPPVLAVGRYRGPLRTAVLRYKERNRRDVAPALAALLGTALDGLPGPPGGLWLVPAPSRPGAARVRAGDHMTRLCTLVATGRDDVRVAAALRLERRASDSVGLDAEQRAANLAGRLSVRPGRLPAPGSTIVLVDDVVTSGATLRACRDALAAAGLGVRAALVLCDATPRARGAATRS